MAPLETDVLICGAGAAGVFCAARIKELSPATKVTILEATNKVLQKVRISGGGRCNVTSGLFWHHKPNLANINYDSFRRLNEFYPRGHETMGRSLAKFGFVDIHEWFETRGVALVREDDGRVFPATNKSQTIIDALMKQVKDTTVLKRARMTNFEVGPTGRFNVHFTHKATEAQRKTIHANAVVLSPGSSQQLWQVLKKKGIEIEHPVPSLFTFNLPETSPLKGLAGVSVADVKLTAELPNQRITTTGPLLITHKGISGPVVLKMSALAAREAHHVGYNIPISIDWSGGMKRTELVELFRSMAGVNSLVKNLCPLTNESGQPLITKRLWSALVPVNKQWGRLSAVERESIAEKVCGFKLTTCGKATFKEEFVTAGGVTLDAISKDYESNSFPGLFCIGEFVNVDGGMY